MSSPSANTPALSGLWQRSERTLAPIVPNGSVTNRALFTVIAIMTFLACICVGLVSMVHQSASAWLANVGQEITVQVVPSETLNEEVEAVLNILRSTPGIDSVNRLTGQQTEKLLAPWLGADVDLSTLPVPQLITVATNRASPPDIAALKREIEAAAPSALLDDHRVWRDQLKSVSQSLTLGGLGLLVLVVVATVASIIFATRGAMQSNREVIEVLDLVGAEPKYVARAFERHFLSLGLKAAVLGGVLTLVMFWSFAVFGSGMGAGSTASDSSSLFGHAGLGLIGHAGIFVAIATVAVLTAITSRLTVSRHIRFAR